MNLIDSFLNRITMYRLVLYYLIALLVAAGVFGFFHVISYSPVALAFSTGVLLLASYVANVLFAKVWGAVPGSASAYITALILALIMSPVAPLDIAGTFLLVLIAFWAMASKYLFAYRGKHLFNPAALAVAISSLFFAHSASWWVGGNVALLPIVVIGGVLVVRKIQRFDLFLSFAAAALITVALTSGSDPLHSVWTTLIHSSFFFLGLVMLTEPATMPPTRAMRIAYAALVGIWFAPALHIGSFYFTPELALLAGNIFVFFVSPKGRLSLALLEKNELAKGTYEFVFEKKQSFSFHPGQYLEWTLPEGEKTDAKGNRRYFTIASAPSEKTIRLAVRAIGELSSFKRDLLKLNLGDRISAAQLAGDFTLPKDSHQKLAFIAGGIGITPFRSMVGELMARKENRDAVLLYSNKTVEEVAYYDFFERARELIGLKTVYALTGDTRTFPHVHTGSIDSALILREMPDYRERTFHISGPRSMVLAFTKALSELGVPVTRIHTDYFPGFV